MAHIDTYKYFKDLRKSGMPEEQADIQVQTLIDTMNGLATKEDLKQTEERLVLEIESTKKDLKQTEERLVLEIESTKKDLKQTEEKLVLKIEGTAQSLKQELLIDLHNLKYSLIKSVVVLIYIPFIIGAFLLWLGKH